MLVVYHTTLIILGRCSISKLKCSYWHCMVSRVLAWWWWWWWWWWCCHL